MPTTGQPLSARKRTSCALPQPGTSTRPAPRGEATKARRRAGPCPRPTARSARRSADPRIPVRRGRVWGSSACSCPNGSPERLYFAPHRCVPRDEAPPASHAAAGLALAACNPGTEAPRRVVRLAACRLPGVESEAQCGKLRGLGGSRGAGGAAHPDQHRRDSRADALAASRTRSSCSPAGRGRARSSLAAAGACRCSRELNDTRDIVLVDQRGTGESQPARLRGRGCAGAVALRGHACPSDVVRKCLARPRRRSAPVHHLDRRRGLRRGARGAGLREDQPLGRLLRHPRRARIPAPARRARAHRGAGRRGALDA